MVFLDSLTLIFGKIVGGFGVVPGVEFLVDTGVVSDRGSRLNGKGFVIVFAPFV